MVQFIHDRNPSSTKIREELDSVPKCPGTCLFIDIVNSTEIKYQSGISDWGQKINNTFNFISLLNEFPDNIVKGIGDEIMLFIPDSELESKTAYNDYLSLLSELYSTIFNIKNFPNNDLFLECKVSIHYCKEVYNITFLEGANDYYGSDIDLTARLMSKAKANRIVLSEDYFQKVLLDYNKQEISTKDYMIGMNSKIHSADFKGIPNPVKYRVLDPE